MNHHSPFTHHHSQRHAGAAALVLALSIAVTFAAPEQGWEQDFDKALQTAREKKQPTLVYFTAGWCQYCRLMEKGALQDEAVVKNLSSLVKVKVDFDANPQLVARYQIRGIPAFVMLDDSGEEAAKTSGAMEAKKFSEWITEGLLQTALAETQKEVFEQKKAGLEKLLQDAEAATRAQGVALLVEFYTRKERLYHEFAAARLKDLARDEPSALVEHLNHSRLGVRILLANLLREKFGEQFQFDPWEKAEARAAALQALKARKP
ncbi:MAG TPA: thioredoxin family protein [Verrucomicrobiae bacterium]|jgi:thioredoxin-like negative regulator of GroEL